MLSQGRCIRCGVAVDFGEQPVAGFGDGVDDRDDGHDVGGLAHRGEYDSPFADPVVDQGLIDCFVALRPGAQHHGVAVLGGHVDHPEPEPGGVFAFVEFGRGHDAREERFASG
jgi:hypothetical protein